MGTTRTMKVKAILFLCLAASVAIWAVTEVQELGNNDAHDDSHESANLDAGDDHVDADDDDSIGEDMGVGRRGGFLSTTGSFQLSSGGGPRGPCPVGMPDCQQGGEELGEGDDLGEDMGVGRRGGFLSTTGSFQLSSGGGPRGPCPVGMPDCQQG